METGMSDTAINAVRLAERIEHPSGGPNNTDVILSRQAGAERRVIDGDAVVEFCQSRIADRVKRGFFDVEGESDV
jgi:hypothetical protein